jgi:hypothetical protein
MKKVERKTKEIMFNTFQQVQKMDEVPYFVKNKMLSAIFKMNPNKWRVIGITEKAILRFAEYEFKYKARMGINRSHIHQRSLRNKALLAKTDWKLDEWWNYFYDRDECILATSTENMSKEELKLSFKVPDNLFRSSGYAYSVKEDETLFLKKIYAKLISDSNEKIAG